PLMREILRMRLAQAEILVVGEAANGSEAVSLVESLSPRLALLDLNMPGTTGLEAISQIEALGGETLTIMYAAGASAHEVQLALDAGASGYLDKSSAMEMLEMALTTVLAGGSFIDPNIARELLAPPKYSITPRELQVLQLMADGLQNKEIAVRTGLSVETIKAHVTSLLTKLDSHSRTGAVTRAMRNQIIV
ncbi:MAG: DNA-binding response regulator, partial [Thermoleophilia bacterium]|nr:DNA-binding response regulator [Thermoleophilia bacterium]